MESSKENQCSNQLSLENLPHEILLLILKELNTKDLVTGIGYVSKRFHQFILDKTLVKKMLQESFGRTKPIIKMLTDEKSTITTFQVFEDKETTLLISGSKDGNIQIWDLQDINKEPRLLVKHECEITCLEVAKVDQMVLLISGLKDGRVEINDLKNNGNHLKTLGNLQESVSFLQVFKGSNSTLLVSSSFHAASIEGSIQIWDLQDDNKCLRTWKWDSNNLGERISSCQIAKIGETTFFIGSSGKGNLLLWDLQNTTEKPRLLAKSEDGINGLRIVKLAHADIVIAASFAGTFRVWNFHKLLHGIIEEPRLINHTKNEYCGDNCFQVIKIGDKTFLLCGLWHMDMTAIPEPHFKNNIYICDLQDNHKQPQKLVEYNHENTHCIMKSLRVAQVGQKILLINQSMDGRIWITDFAPPIFQRAQEKQSTLSENDKSSAKEKEQITSANEGVFQGTFFGKTQNRENQSQENKQALDFSL